MRSLLLSFGHYHVAPVIVSVLKAITWVPATTCFVIFIITLNAIWHGNNDGKIITLKSVKYFSLLSLLSFSLCLFGQSGVEMYRDDTMQVSPGSWYIVTMICIPLATWTLGQVFMYILFMSNLHYTFGDTIFRVPRYAFIILAVLIILFVTLRFLYIIFYVFYYVGWVTNSYFSFRAAITVSVTEIIDLVISINLLYLFLNRLFTLYVININQNSKSNLRNQVDYKQQSILSVASKYSILSFLAIFSTQLFLIAAVNNDFSFSIPHSSWYIDGYIVYCCLLSFNCIVNCVCIFLNLDVNAIHYYTICGSCDNCCYSCCITISRKYLLKKGKKRKHTIQSASNTDLHINIIEKKRMQSTVTGNKIAGNRDKSINSTITSSLSTPTSTYYNLLTVDNLLTVTSTDIKQ